MTGKVVVIGGANLDIRAVSAEPLIEGTSNPGRVRIMPGGVARNIAEHLARLGVDTALISAVGDDPAGHQILAQSVAAGVDITGVSIVSSPTGIYSAILDHDGNLATAVNAMAIIEAITPEQVLAHRGKLQAADFIIVDCNLGAGTLKRLAGFARERGKRLIVDPVSVPKCLKLEAMLEVAPLFAATPNRAQAEKLTGHSCATPQMAERAAQDLRDRGIGLVVLHLDRDGVLVLDASEGAPKSEVIPLQARNDAPRDVTGGGDAAIAGLVYALVHGQPATAAARIGQIAAASVLESADGRIEVGAVREAAGQDR
ncbi:MAG: carbohydrate kinase family protein [Rhizobiales bacterium]|nr:carbohydrate kinase family protein [Hyphomicrobiales bacterium]